MTAVATRDRAAHSEDTVAADQTDRARRDSFIPGLFRELEHFRRMARKSAGMPEAAREHQLWCALAAELSAYLEAPSCDVVSLFDFDDEDPG